MIALHDNIFSDPDFLRQIKLLPWSLLYIMENSYSSLDNWSIVNLLLIKIMALCPIVYISFLFSKGPVFICYDCGIGLIFISFSLILPSDYYCILLYREINFLQHCWKYLLLLAFVYMFGLNSGLYCVTPCWTLT